MLDYKGCLPVYEGGVIPMLDDAPDIERIAPSYEVFAPTGTPNGKAMIILPGGGYHNYGRGEALPVAEYFSKIGYVSFIVWYRFVPYRYPAALYDVQRVIRNVRRDADKYGIGRNKISLIGFSAGGHLALMAAEKFDCGSPDGEGAGKESCRPDRVILGYPVVSMLPPYAHSGSACNLLGEKADDEDLLRLLSGELNVREDCPPMFLWHCKPDDCVDYRGTAALADALTAAGVENRLCLYDDGDHALGLALDRPTVPWVKEYLAWDSELDAKGL